LNEAPVTYILYGTILKNKIWSRKPIYWIPCRGTG